VADYRLYREVRWPDFLNDSALAPAYGVAAAKRLGGDPNGSSWWVTAPAATTPRGSRSKPASSEGAWRPWAGASAGRDAHFRVLASRAFVTHVAGLAAQRPRIDAYEASEVALG
jgi:hypothetical protein